RLVVGTPSGHEGLEANRESMARVVRSECVDVTTHGRGLLSVAPSVDPRRQVLAQVLLELAPPHPVLSALPPLRTAWFGDDIASCTVSRRWALSSPVDGCPVRGERGDGSVRHT